MEDDLFEKFNCPICFEIPEKEIFQCRNGHTVCFGCGKSISQCPQCRVKLESPKIRCRALEELLDIMRFDCANKSLGCTTKLKRYEIQNHIKSCTYKVQTINVCELVGYSCGFSINTESLQQAVTHLKTSHDFIVCRSVDVDINLEGFESANSRKNSMWTPVLVDMTTQNSKLFVLLSLVNGFDLTLSFVCLDISEDSIKGLASEDFKAVFKIDAINSDERPDINWTTNPLQVKHMASEINEPMHRFPLSLLRKRYIKDGFLLVKCSILNNIRSIGRVVRNPESVYALNIHKNPPKGYSNPRLMIPPPPPSRRQTLSAPPIASTSSRYSNASNPFWTSHRTSRTSLRYKHRPPPPPPIAQTIFNSFVQTVQQATDSLLEVGTEIIFTGVSCNECRKRPVKIIRFKCLQCPNYDLCKPCFDKGKHNHHTFAMIQNMDQNECLKNRWNLALAATPYGSSAADSSFTWNSSYLKCNQCSNEKKYVCLDCCSLVGYCTSCFRNVNHVENHCFAVTETVSKLGFVVSLLIQSKFNPDETMRLFTSTFL